MKLLNWKKEIEEEPLASDSVNFTVGSKRAEGDSSRRKCSL